VNDKEVERVGKKSKRNTQFKQELSYNRISKQTRRSKMARNKWMEDMFKIPSQKELSKREELHCGWGCGEVFFDEDKQDKHQDTCDYDDDDMIK